MQSLFSTAGYANDSEVIYIFNWTCGKDHMRFLSFCYCL